MVQWLEYFAFFALSVAWVGGSAALFAQGAAYGSWRYLVAGAFGGCVFLATFATIISH